MLIFDNNNLITYFPIFAFANTKVKKYLWMPSRLSFSRILNTKKHILHLRCSVALAQVLVFWRIKYLGDEKCHFLPEHKTAGLTPWWNVTIQVCQHFSSAWGRIYRFSLSQLPKSLAETLICVRSDLADIHSYISASFLFSTANRIPLNRNYES